MTKDVVVRVTGLHALEGDSGEISVVTPGSYYFRNGKHYLVYEERLEGQPEPVRCTVLTDGKRVWMIRTDAGIRMEFEAGRTTMSCYSTPYGTMTMNITTTSVDVMVSEEQIRIGLEYTLEINGVGVSHVRANVSASPRRAGGEN